MSLPHTAISAHEKYLFLPRLVGAPLGVLLLLEVLLDQGYMSATMVFVALAVGRLQPQLRNNTDWSSSNVADDPVVPHAATLDECVAICALRKDCVAVSWTSLAGPPGDKNLCSLKCSALEEKRVVSPGHIGVILRPGEVACPGAGWFPRSWQQDIDAGSLLLAGPDQQGATVGNGYVAAWIKSLAGTAGPVQSGVEHVVGVFAGRNAKVKPEGCVSWCDRAHKADIPSFTSTATITSLGGEFSPSTATAMDLRRGAFLRASSTKDGSIRCVQTTYAHRSRKHLLITEFRCSNSRSSPVELILSEPGPNPIAVS